MTTIYRPTPLSPLAIGVDRLAHGLRRRWLVLVNLALGL